MALVISIRRELNGQIDRLLAGGPQVANDRQLDRLADFMPLDDCQQLFDAFDDAAVDLHDQVAPEDIAVLVAPRGQEPAIAARAAWRNPADEHALDPQSLREAAREVFRAERRPGDDARPQQLGHDPLHGIDRDREADAGRSAG